MAVFPAAEFIRVPGNAEGFTKYGRSCTKVSRRKAACAPELPTAVPSTTPVRSGAKSAPVPVPVPVPDPAPAPAPASASASANVQADMAS